ncbi:MAG: hypothetical protein H7Z42_00100 [Roseiflexaceae bacterium]|nr:hypothetical protein [Roseiflexaceae bacterium]
MIARSTQRRMCLDAQLGVIRRTVWNGLAHPHLCAAPLCAGPPSSYDLP